MKSIDERISAILEAHSVTMSDDDKRRMHDVQILTDCYAATLSQRYEVEVTQIESDVLSFYLHVRKMHECAPPCDFPLLQSHDDGVVIYHRVFDNAEAPMKIVNLLNLEVYRDC